MGIKSRLKEALQQHEAVWGTYLTLKDKVVRVHQFTFHLHDLKTTHRFMRWTAPRRARKSLSAELLFQYHKLEKGLVMPGTPRMFGADPSAATIRLLQSWMAAGHPQNDPIFIGAVETLSAYLRRIKALQLDRDGHVSAQVERFLTHELPRDEALLTPMPLAPQNATPQSPWHAFHDLAHVRRSVRDFKPDPVSREALSQAVSLAMLSPSACNRQPWHVRAYQDAETVKKLLRHQNGNRGFGHLVPTVLMISVDQTCFFDASERNQPYVDGGLFSMSLVYGLAAQGLGTCCLNWCVTPKTDDAVHREFNVPAHERIIMLLAVGHPPEGVMVPKSPRRAVDDVMLPPRKPA